MENSNSANTLCVIVCHLLEQPEKVKRLRAELIDSETTSLQKLEKLPYLTAIIHEGLRHSLGQAARFIRVQPNEGVNYHGYSFPAGTPISMSPLIMNMDPIVFPNPLAFQPERWLDGELGKEDLYTFSKGPRMCVGIQ